MEKDQHEQENQNREQGQAPAKAAPGQQLPAGGKTTELNSMPAGEERHSDSSLPQQDNETLGTP